jgi:hypothetical protein
MGYEVTLNGEVGFASDRQATIEEAVREAVAPFVWGHREGQALEPSVEALLGLAGFYRVSKRSWVEPDADKEDTTLVVDFTGKWTDKHEALLVALAKAGVSVWLNGGGTGDLYDLWELRTHNGVLTEDRLAYSWELFRREGRVSWDGENRRVEVKQTANA